MADREKIVGTISRFLRRQKKETVALDASLFAEGIGLDSLQTAELSAILEDELGKDPFSEGLMPNTINEIVDYYDEAPAGEKN